MILEGNALAANGLVYCPLSADEEPEAVIKKIEELVYAFIGDLVQGRADGSLTMIRRTHSNAIEDPLTGALFLGQEVTVRRFNQRSAPKISQLFQVLSVIYKLVLYGKRISQREIFYMLIESFKNQEQLNRTILDASATLGVPRYALNIGAATRGVIAGCLELATAGSLYKVDCRYVGTNGWPIPGDVREACSIIVHSKARYIIVVEKFGIFSRLVQDKVYDLLPSIFVCGKGYPSVSTRAVTSLLERRLRIPVLGLADFNPHGLALLQCYRRGSARSGVEGWQFGCNMRWLGLRSSHIRAHAYLGLPGVPLTGRDEAVLRGLAARGALDGRHEAEAAAMRRLGKVELQWLYGHADGAKYVGAGFVVGAVLRADYL